MTINISEIGPNSRSIEINDETSSLGIIDAVNTSLVDLGQTLIDSLSSGQLNCLVTKVYSAPNDDFDGIMNTTKYMIIRYDGPRQQQRVSCCEFWDTTSHSATNECQTGGGAIILPLQYSSCVLFVFASPRYAAFIGRVHGVLSAWQGVFEFERTLPEDTASNGIPCFGQTSSLTIGHPFGHPHSGTTVGNLGQYSRSLAVPRDFKNNIGNSAVVNLSLIVNYEYFPPQKYSFDLASQFVKSSYNIHNGHLAAFNGNYALINKNILTGSICVGSTLLSEFYITGRIYGLSVAKLHGTEIFKTINVKMDEKNFLDSTGTDKLNIIMGMNGGYSGTIVETNKINITGPFNFDTNKFIHIRNNFYFATANGLVEFNFISGVQTQLTSTWCKDLVFDGNYYLYFTVAATTLDSLGRLNLLTKEIVYSQISGNTLGRYAISIDDNYIFASSHAVNTTMPLYIYNINDFQYRSTSSLTIVGENRKIDALECCDYKGYAIASLINPISIANSGSNQKIQKIDGDTGTVYTTSITQPLTGTSASMGALVQDGEYLSQIGTTTGTIKQAKTAIYNTNDSPPTQIINQTNTVDKDSGLLTSTNNVYFPYKGYQILMFHYTVVGYVAYESGVPISSHSWIPRLEYSLSSYSDGCSLQSCYVTKINNIFRSVDIYDSKNNGKYESSRILIPT